VVTPLIANLPVSVIHRREQWYDLNKDRKWRMFERVVITDRQAAHKEKSSMSSKWNKMLLNVLLQPLPPSPINFWLGAQVATTEGLELPSIPSIRREHGKSLVIGQIKIVCVSRQGSTRKFAPRPLVPALIAGERIRCNPVACLCYQCLHSGDHLSTSRPHSR
jgi:hypothetical protein